MTEKLKLQWFFGIMLTLLLVASTAASTSFFADDLGFDFAGYAVRYTSTFEGWIKNHHFGVPVSTFDGWLPGLLPLAFKGIGFGSFTAPLELSILIMRLLLIAGIMFIAREYGLRKETGFLLGAILAVNPITFKFLNRYYELFAWACFLFAIVFILRFLNNKSPQKSLAFAVLLSVMSLLSHFSPTFFLVLFGLFIAKSNFPDAKKLFSIGFFSIGLSLFWVVPFLAYAGYSGITSFDSSALQTLGMTASSLFLLFLLVVFLALFLKTGLNKKYSREFQLLALTAVLAAIKFAFPNLPLLNKPFIHSFNFFYIIVLAISSMIIVKEIKNINFPRRAFVVLALAAIIPGIFFAPKIIGNYSFVEPRLSSYDYLGEKIDFALIDAEMQKISRNERFEILPSDPIINAYAMAKHDLSTAYGWGYNIVAINNSNQKALETIASAENCAKFNQDSRDFGISKWLALNRKALDELAKCHWLSEKAVPPALFMPPQSENFSIVDNGELLEYSNTRIIVKASPPETTIKVNFFSRWNAYSGGEKIAIKSDEKNSFILVPVEKEKIIDLRHESTFIDYAAIILSFVFILLFALFLKTSPLN